MVADLLRIVLATALVAVVPGYLLVRALWPDRDDADAPGPLARGLLTVVLSVMLTVLVGVGLGFAPHAEGARGWLQTSGTGFPFAEAALIILSLLFYAWGLKRGAWRPRAAR